jgi:hypothetical protein
MLFPIPDIGGVQLIQSWLKCTLHAGSTGKDLSKVKKTRFLNVYGHNSTPLADIKASDDIFQ